MAARGGWEEGSRPNQAGGKALSATHEIFVDAQSVIRSTNLHGMLVRRFGKDASTCHEQAQVPGCPAPAAPLGIDIHCIHKAETSDGGDPATEPARGILADCRHSFQAVAEVLPESE